MLRRRASTTVAAAAAADDWNILQGTFEGRPMFARFNPGFRAASDRGEYGIQVGVAIPLNAPNEHGLPAPPELEQLDQIEDEVVEKARDRAVLVGVFTTSSMREFVLYTRTSDWVESFHHELEVAVPTHEVQCMAQRDPDWNVYRTFVG
jgi:hypothetical protein